MASVIIYQFGGHRRSRLITNSMLTGIKRAGDKVRIVQAETYKEPAADVAVFYGLKEQCISVFEDYPKAGLKVVYIDLGYWGRHDGGRYAGYHKLSVNSRHPTDYFQARRHPNDRAMKLGIKPAAWRKDGEKIILAGMGAKGAEADGFEAEAWELSAIAAIRKYTDRPIIYRPKPSWKGATPIEGTTFSPKAEALTDILPLAHSIVTHHSNVAVDGLVYGIPAFCWTGVATPLASQDLETIENPRRPDDRRQWISDVAYTQFTPGEMASGLAWRHLKNEGLVP